jgi:hypothetical protein
MQEAKLYLIFEFLTMDLKKYMDTNVPKDGQMDAKLVKSYTYQLLQVCLPAPTGTPTSSYRYTYQLLKVHLPAPTGTLISSYRYICQLLQVHLPATTGTTTSS